MGKEFFPFRTVAERFHLIDDKSTVTVYIPRDDGAELITRLRAGECSRILYRQLGQYGVSIYQDHWRELDRAGVLEPLGDGSFVLIDIDLYSDTTGLYFEARTGEAKFA